MLPWLWQVPGGGQARGFPAQLASQLETRAKTPISGFPAYFWLPSLLLASQPTCGFPAYLWLPSLFAASQPPYYIIMASQPSLNLSKIFKGFPAHGHKNKWVAPPSRNLSGERALQNIYYRRVAHTDAPAGALAHGPAVIHLPKKKGWEVRWPQSTVPCPTPGQWCDPTHPCGRIWVGLSYVQ